MVNKNKINYYHNNINLREVIEALKLKTIDEALFVCDLEQVKEKYELWKKLMPSIKPYYAVKCNDDSYVVETLANLGTNFDCASKNEIKQVLDLGVDPERIIFANPCKPVSHIEFVKKKNVKTSTVDNECEIYKIHKIYPESNLVIRFRCDAKDADFLLGDKFGCDAERDAPALMLLAKKLNLNVIGTSFHVGSGCNDLPVYDRAITIAKNLSEFGLSLGYEMNLVDIGGGFPGTDDKKFEIISKIINNSLQRNFPDANVNVIAEPGKYFAESSCTLICKIHGKREIRSPEGTLLTKMYYLNDGVFGSFCCSLFDSRHITVKHFLNDQNNNLPIFKTIIWGPTCHPSDKIAEHIELPDLNVGDFLAFPNMGAYTITLGSTFNGFPLAKILYFQKFEK